VEFGSDEGTSADDLQNAINEKTAAVHFYMVEQEHDPKALSLEKTIQIAHDNDLPVLVDAAGQIYPLDLFGKYVKMGADFQCIAAKYMGASQSTGLALGSEDMIRKISKQSFVGYEGRRIRGIGRPHKVDRQEMVGVVAAVKTWMTINHEERLADIEDRSQKFINILSDMPGINTKMIGNIIGHQPFGVELRIDETKTGMSAPKLVETLKEGDPPIWTRVRDGDDYIAIHMFGLKVGEEEIVAERIKELFI